MGDPRHVAIVGGRVVPATSAPLDEGTVLITDGRIAAVDTDVDVPPGTRVVDARGSWVLPGFVDAHTHLGIDEEAGGWAGNDLNETPEINGARLRAIDAINPADIGFRDALGGGVTTVVVLPGSTNPIGGQGAVLKCWGGTVDDRVVRAPVGVKSALGENPKRAHSNRNELPSTRLGVAAVIRDAFAEARRHRDRADAFDPTLDVLVRVLDGELPLLQHAHRADDIATALRLADEFGYRLILNHGTEAHDLAELLAARSVPVTSGPLIGTRTKPELARRTLASPAILTRAGVLVALTTDHNELPIDFLVHQATFAIKAGLAPEDALRAVTVNPARILGIDDRVGDVRVGLDGDVVLWSGDPFDVYSRVLRVFVDGQEVPDVGGGTA
ncbi:MAG TPA: amidohydrolase [Pseudonocardiaceae bacterium]|nr:amidohydrolase [Pseudonocardiaceae bacterium]